MSSIIFEWLERIGLGYAVPHFMAMGVDTPQALMGIDVQTYSMLGIHAQDDRGRLFELVQRVRDVREGEQCHPSLAPPPHPPLPPLARFLL
jgi:hypothetical protein